MLWSVNGFVKIGCGSVCSASLFLGLMPSFAGVVGCVVMLGDAVSVGGAVGAVVPSLAFLLEAPIVLMIPAATEDAALLLLARRLAAGVDDEIRDAVTAACDLVIRRVGPDSSKWTVWSTWSSFWLLSLGDNASIFH